MSQGRVPSGYRPWKACLLCLLQYTLEMDHAIG